MHVIAPLGNCLACLTTDPSNASYGVILICVFNIQKGPTLCGHRQNSGIREEQLRNKSPGWRQGWHKAHCIMSGKLASTSMVPRRVLERGNLNIFDMDFKEREFLSPSKY